jgi:hypothetical protein
MEKCLKIILVWKKYLSKFFKMKRMNENEPSKVACSNFFNGNLIAKMHFIGFFSMLMTTKTLIVTTSNDVLCSLL